MESNHEAWEEQSPGSQHRLWIALDGKRGYWKWSRKDQPQENAQDIKGILERIDLEYDEQGNPEKNVKPGWILNIDLIHRQLGPVQLQIRAMTALRNVIRKMGEHFTSRTPTCWTAQYSDPVTFVECHYWNGQSWAYETDCPKWEGSTNEEKDAEALLLAIKLPAFDKSRIGPVKAHPKFPIPGRSQPSATASAAPANPSVDAQAPADSPSAFDVVFAPWPVAALWDKPRTEKQLESIDALLAKHELGDGDVNYLRDALEAKLPVPPGKTESKGFAGLLIMFLMRASGMTLRQAIAYAQYDPFA